MSFLFSKLFVCARNNVRYFFMLNRVESWRHKTWGFHHPKCKFNWCAKNMFYANSFLGIQLFNCCISLQLFRLAIVHEMQQQIYHKKHCHAIVLKIPLNKVNPSQQRRRNCIASLLSKKPTYLNTLCIFYIRDIFYRNISTCWLYISWHNFSSQ